MPTIEEVEKFKLFKSEDLCKLVETLGYKRSSLGQLTCKNGAEVSSLLDFFDDNPDALEAVREWILDNVELEETCEECSEPLDKYGSCVNDDCPECSDYEEEHEEDYDD